MSIFVIGINHKTASITLRENVYFAEDLLTLYLQDLLSRGDASEAVILSTCNRSELYCVSEAFDAIRDWFCAQASLPRHEIESAIYCYQDKEAVAHIMQVACGLDSMILGEPQILGQMKEAFSESCATNMVGPLFHRLFQQVFTVAKEIRTTTAIGACPVSVASAAVHFAKQYFTGEFNQAQVVLIGAGDTSHLLMRYLKQHLQKPVIVVNRHVEKAAMFADEFAAHVWKMDQLPSALVLADIVFSATGSTVPIVTKEMMTAAMPARGDAALMLIDVAMPRDIEPAVANLANTQLYCIDDLKILVEKNRQGREHAADKARELIVKKSSEFIVELASHDKVMHTIRAYRGQVEEICRVELNKAKQLLDQGMDPARALEVFAQAFMKKLLHNPSVQLRQAGVEGRFDLLSFAKQLFSIPDPEIERI